jgi:hypothetical protein
MYIRTENGVPLDSSNYDAPYVIPLNSESWSLCMKKKEGGETEIIADFDTVEAANVALMSLSECRKNPIQVGWDAKEYKDDLGIITKPKPVAP